MAAARIELHDVVAEARRELWRRGHLRWTLHSSQQEVYDAIYACQDRRFVVEISRQWGKTWLLVTIAFETCLRTPKARVVYGAPTLKHLAEFIIPTFEAVALTAPPECRPVWNQAKGHFEFPNGSYVHLFGADDRRKASRGRGPKAALVIFDEAGFTPILLHILDDIFKAQTLHSGGRTLLGSTPAEEPDHDFTEIAEIAEKNGNYARRTIYDNPLLTPEVIQRFIDQGARDKGLTPEEYEASDTFRREYLAERVVNKLLLVVPEWQAKRGDLVKAIPRPEYFDAMTVLDPGGGDPHAVTFGYWHFALAKFVVEDELNLRDGENTLQLADAIKAKEKDLWGTDKHAGTLRALHESNPALLAAIPQWMIDSVGEDAPPQPYSRWSDTNLIMVRDLYSLHGLAFAPTAKDDKQAAVNNVRVMVNRGELLVHPRCKDLDRQLRTTMWANHKRQEYARRGGEHGDLLDTVVYGARNLERGRNPEPVRSVGPDGYVSVKTVGDTNLGQSLAEAFLGDTELGQRLLKGNR